MLGAAHKFNCSQQEHSLLKQFDVFPHAEFTLQNCSTDFPLVDTVVEIADKSPRSEASWRSLSARKLIAMCGLFKNMIQELTKIWLKNWSCQEAMQLAVESRHGLCVCVRVCEKTDKTVVLATFEVLYRDKLLNLCFVLPAMISTLSLLKALMPIFKG